MIFISHSQEDKSTALRVVQFLEQNNFKCWITPRDISPGDDWAEAIISAIEESDSMVLILSSSSNLSPHVRREVENAVSLCKKIIPVLIEDVKLSKWMKYCISIHQWHDACTGSLDLALPALYNALLGKDGVNDYKLLYTADQIEDELRSFPQKSGNTIQLEPSELRPLIIASIKLPSTNNVLVRRSFPLLTKLAEMHSGILLPGDNDDRLRCFFGVTTPFKDCKIDAVAFAQRAFHLIAKMLKSLNAPTERDPYGIAVVAGVCELSWIGQYPVIRGILLKEADSLSNHCKLYASFACYNLCGNSEWVKDKYGYVIEQSVLPETKQNKFTFVGRHPTLELLSELLKKQRISSEMNRRGGALHIVQGILGEAGMGKTSLLNKFLEQTATSPKAIVYPSLDVTSGTQIDLTGFLLKEYKIQYDFHEGIKSFEDTSAEQNSQKLFMFAQIRDRLSTDANNGLIFVIDDAQKLSPTDIALLDFLIENTDSQKSILFLFLYRKTNQEGKRVKFSFSGSFASSAESELKPLTVQDSTSLINHTLCQLSGMTVQASSNFLELIYKKTDGNPFYLTEITKEYFNNKYIELKNGIWSMKNGLSNLHTSLPLSLTINAAIDSLPLSWKRTLQVCSVIGDNLPISILKHIERLMPKGWFSIEILSYLTERQYLKREQTAFRDYYQFRHDLLREAAISGILQENKISIHNAIAATYEEIFSDNENYHKITAEHWVETGNQKKIEEWGNKALTLCMRTFKHTEALLWIARLKKFRTGPKLTKLILTESDILGFLGRQTDRIELIEQQLGIDKENNIDEYIPNLYLHLGITRLEKGEIEIAEEHLRKAQDCVARKSANQLTAKIQTTLGSLLIDTGGFDEARELLIKAMKQYSLSDSRKGEAETKRIQAELHYKLGQLNESVDLCKEVLIYTEKAFNKQLQLSCLSAIGRAYYHLGKLEDAALYWKKDIEIATELGFRFNECVVTRNMGGIYYVKGELDEALNSFKNSYEIAKELDDKKNMGSALRNMTFTLQRMGRRDETKPFLDESLQLSRDSGDIEAEANSLLALGMFLDQKDDLDEAIDTYNKCIELSKISNNLITQATSLANLAGVFEKASKVKKAIPLALESLELFKQINNKSSQLCMFTNVGSLYCSIDNLGKAYTYLKAGLDLSEELDDTQYRTFLLSSLASYYLSKKNFVKALEFSQKAHETAEKVNASPKGKAHASALFAHILIIHSKEFTKAEKLLKTIKTIADKNDLVIERVTVPCLTGLIAFYRGDLIRANKCLNTATKLCEERKPPMHSLLGFEELQAAVSIK